MEVTNLGGTIMVILGTGGATVVVFNSIRFDLVDIACPFITLPINCTSIGPECVAFSFNVNDAFTPGRHRLLANMSVHPLESALVPTLATIVSNETDNMPVFLAAN